MDRRRFLRTSCGMAAAFVAMNNVFGNLFDVSEAEAVDVTLAAERAAALNGQFIFDVQTHFVRDDYKQEGFNRPPEVMNASEKSGLDPDRISVYNVKFEKLRPADLPQQRHSGGGAERHTLRR